MGLLARASKEAQADLSESPKGHVAPAGRSASAPLFDSKRIATLRSRLAGKADILAVKCSTSTKESWAGLEATLVGHLATALGPNSEIYRAPDCVLAFAAPSGDWDPTIYEIQLRALVEKRLAAGTGKALTFRIGRIPRHSSSFEKDLSRLIGS